MRDADRRDACIVYDTPYNVWTSHEPFQYRGEVVSFADETHGWRLGPGFELPPSLVLIGCAVLPDAPVRDHAEKLVAAWPRNRPRGVALGEILHERTGGIAESRFAAMCIDKHVGIDGDHRVPGSPYIRSRSSGQERLARGSGAEASPTRQSGSRYGRCCAADARA